MFEEFIRSCARFVSGKVLPRGIAYPILRGPLRGYRFILGALAGEGGGGSVYLGMVEPEQTVAFCNTVQQGDVIFDIGANVGYYTLLGAHLAGESGRIVSVEPMIQNICRLNRHLVLNRLNNVFLVTSACSDHVGMSVFLHGANNAVGHLDGIGDVNHSTNKMSVVSTVTIDALVDTTKLEPNMIKVDVEGAEYQVLLGAANTLTRLKPKLYLSIHSQSLYVKCNELLSTYGYDCTPLHQSGAGVGEWCYTHSSQSTT